MLRTVLALLPISGLAYAEGETLRLRDAIIEMASEVVKTPRGHVKWTRKTFRGYQGKLRAQSLAGVFVQEAEKVGIDPYLLAAVAANESDYREHATGLVASECGIMQIHPESARYFGCDDRNLLCTDARHNIRCGAKALAFYRNKCGGKTENWLGAYNTGRCGWGKDYAKKVLDLLRRAKRTSPAASAPPR